MGLGHAAPQTCAFLMPSQGWTGLGWPKRSASAYLMPRKVRVLPSRRPRSLPDFRVMMGGFRFGEVGVAAFGAAGLSWADAVMAAAPARLAAAVRVSRVRRLIPFEGDGGVIDLRYYDATRRAN